MEIHSRRLLNVLTHAIAGSRIVRMTNNRSAEGTLVAEMGDFVAAYRISRQSTVIVCSLR